MENTKKTDKKRLLRGWKEQFFECKEIDPKDRNVPGFNRERLWDAPGAEPVVPLKKHE